MTTPMTPSRGGGGDIGLDFGEGGGVGGRGGGLSLCERPFNFSTWIMHKKKECAWLEEKSGWIGNTKPK